MNKQILIKNLKSKTFWVAIGAFVLYLLHSAGVGVVDTQYNDIINAVLQLLVLMGILNSPQIDTEVK
ncbi:small integral membrane protein [Clostridium pasteurianum]|uniref:Small integral membrane protein n=1 Tax=Clostridium pasteurianum BC1 TaxID=86416 RepID=R4K8G0_CLOPA|nr:small integral membrane protein [Clostridium pasteurianum]AGK96819.1 small integral membrane protein [Clostridium pasteurianum BC1]